MAANHHCHGESFYGECDNEYGMEDWKVDDFHRELGPVEGETAKVNGELATPH